MSYLQVVIYLFGMLWGTVAMSFETTFNQETREAFKKSIHYSTLTVRQVPERVVQLNGKKFFQKIVDGDGNKWVGVSGEPALGAWGEGQLRATLKSNKGTAIVEITSLSGYWQQRLDYLVWISSLTNRAAVNLKVVPGIEDLYLTPLDDQGVSSATFLYGNLCVSITQWDAGDIDALAKAIHHLMQELSRPRLANHSPSFKLVADKTRLTPGEKVAIKVESAVQNWNSQWIYNQPQQLLGDEVEYLETKDNVFFFKALKKGKIQIPFAAMNTQTLAVESQTVDLVID